MSIKELISDILLAISWREIAKHKFGKSSSWFYEKLDNDSFTTEERVQLKTALNDLSEKIRSISDKI